MFADKLFHAQITTEQDKLMFLSKVAGEAGSKDHGPLRVQVSLPVMTPEHSETCRNRD